jgi:hypothetical protein
MAVQPASGSEKTFTLEDVKRYADEVNTDISFAKEINLGPGLDLKQAREDAKKATLERKFSEAMKILGRCRALAWGPVYGRINEDLVKFRTRLTEEYYSEVEELLNRIEVLTRIKNGRKAWELHEKVVEIFEKAKPKERELARQTALKKVVDESFRDI